MLVRFDELRGTLERALLRLGVTGERAALSSRLIAEADRDGVHTHGIARFPLFADMITAGHLSATAEPTVTARFGALERWNGNLGPGNLAAHAAMARAMELAAQHGLGGVAMANTAHWQRGGTYGWQAAEAGFAAICWTNTLPNLPPWGATTPALGNNPLVIAIPREGDGGPAPIVLDMAMSQYSYGTLAAYRQRGQALPFAGGFDAAGELTTDAGAIETSRRALPIGLWKGSGLSFALDVLGAMLADGQATYQIPNDFTQEMGLSQVFLAMSPEALRSNEGMRAIASEAIAFLHAAEPIVAGRPARYPGERTLETRAENLAKGVPVPEAPWATTQRLAAGEVRVAPVDRGPLGFAER